MSSKQDDSSGAAMVIGFVAAGVILVGLFMAAVATFAAFVLTILAVMAWNNPLKMGRWTLEPSEARSFVFRGVAGALLVPMFIAFSDVFFSLTIDWAYFPYFLVGGYVGGSVWIGYLSAHSTPNEPMAPLVQQIEHRDVVEHSSPKNTRAFEFASWEDEGDSK